MKYHNKKAYCAHKHVHASIKEAEYCNGLHALQENGVISELEVQKPFVLLESHSYSDMPNERGIKYVADFVYRRGDGKIIVVDTKGYKTTDYIIKRKLFKAKYCADNPNIIFCEV